MALCTEPCCNAEKRKAIEAEAAALFAERNTAFEAWLADHEAKALMAADPNDKTFAAAVDAIGYEVKTTAR